MREKKHLRMLFQYCLIVAITFTTIRFTFASSHSIQDGFLGADLDLCLGDTLSLQAPLAFSYLWSTGHTTQFIQIYPDVTTTYWVRITNLQGLTESDTITISVKDPPIVNISPAVTYLLPGEAVLLKASGGESYLWSNGSQDNKLFVEPAFPENTYTVEGIGTNGCMAIAEAKVFVDYTTVPSFNYSKVCFGDTTHFQANIHSNDTILSIEWDLNGDLNFDDAIGDSAFYVMEKAEENLVGIKVRTKYSETAHIAYLPVKTGTIPLPYFDYSGGCSGSAVQFTDRSTVETGEIIQWIWNFGNGGIDTVSNPTRIYSKTGTYPVLMKLVTDFGCSSDFSKNIIIKEPPTVDLRFPDGTAFNPNETYKMFKYDTLNLVASGIYDSVIWNNQNKGKFIQITRGGSHHVAVFQGGCVSSVSFVVDKSDLAFSPDYEIQNILTPNGDGYNDIWEISILGGLSPAKVIIYSRAGLKVYESSNYQNDWEGTYNNNPLPEGSYFYVIEGKGGETIKGTITLIR